MDEQPSVGGKAVRAMRRVVRYCGTEPLPLRVAVAVAIAARHVGGGVAVGYRDRWCDGRDPSELFLLGVDPGGEMTLETTGPRAGELLDELQQLMESPPAASVRPPSEPEV